ncbi:MAG: PAS domain-containing protein, partial [Sphingomonadales bacterium]|nr:PAS domain-containing protein [Sphingomonadales bacterium]
DESAKSQLDKNFAKDRVTVIHESPLFRDHDVIDAETHILIATPIISPTGENIGVLGQVIDINWALTSLTQTLNFRDYGEIYAVSPDGLILTSTRLLSEHPSYGVNQAGRSHQKLFATDPTQASGALTRSALSTSQGYSGLNISGYTDYRGQKVVGAWRWMPELGIGLIVEEDTIGAYAGLNQTHNALFLLSGTVIVLIMLSGLLIRINQRRLDRNRQYLREITDNIPGIVFRREMKPGKKPYFTFISRSRFDDILLHKNTSAIRQMDNTGRLPEDEARLLYSEINRLVHENDIAAYGNAVHISAKNMTRLDHVFRLNTKDGRTKWFRDISSPQKSEDGLIVWSGIWLDVTEQLKAEHALRNINETLELRVTERTQELSVINQDMENTIFERERAETEALRAKDEAL